MERAEPMRRCILTRMSLPTSRLVRFVVAPDRTVVPDVAEKLPGRGLWLRAERDIIDRACSTQLFARTSGENVVQPTDLSDRLEQLLAARCFDLIGLARRAGQAVSGYEKVRAKLRHKMTRHGVGAILLIASDGPSAAASRMDALTQGAVILQAFDGAEIGAAFGRKRVVYAVIGCGQIADSLVVEMCRLEGLRSTPNSGKPN
jgi:predicted RNA-binding protein YlxR (DUF448 family)